MNLDHGKDYGSYWDDLLSGNTADFLGGSSGNSVAQGRIAHDEEPPWGLAAYGYGGNGSSSSSSSSKSKVPEPVLDEEGNPLKVEDVIEALEHLEQSRLNIDRDVRKVEDPEEQALEAKRLLRAYDDLERRLEGQIRDIRRWEEYQLEQIGARNYEMDTDEGNIAITEMVNDEVEWFEDQFGRLKQKLAKRVRARLDELEAKGTKVSVDSRERIYEDFVDEEVIEAWEPLEF